MKHEEVVVVWCWEEVWKGWWVLQPHRILQEEPQEQGLEASLQQLENLHWQSENLHQTN